LLTCLQASAYIGADTSLDSASDPAANIILPGDDSSAAAAVAASTAAGKGLDIPVLPVVPFEACINKFAAAEVSKEVLLESHAAQGWQQCILILMLEPTAGRAAAHGAHTQPCSRGH
jgi:hypothetical protein